MIPYLGSRSFVPLVKLGRRYSGLIYESTLLSTRRLMIFDNGNKRRRIYIKDKVKLFLFWLLTYALFEGTMAMALWVLDEFRNLRYDPKPSELSDQQRESLERFLELDAEQYTSFDPVLGWKLDREFNAAGCGTIESMRRSLLTAHCV